MTLKEKINKKLRENDLTKHDISQKIHGFKRKGNKFINKIVTKNHRLANCYYRYLHKLKNPDLMKHYKGNIIRIKVIKLQLGMMVLLPRWGIGYIVESDSWKIGVLLPGKIVKYFDKKLLYQYAIYNDSLDKLVPLSTHFYSSVPSKNMITVEYKITKRGYAIPTKKYFDKYIATRILNTHKGGWSIMKDLIKHDIIVY